MRRFLFALVICMYVSPSLWAELPVDARLDFLLRTWQEKQAAVQGFRCKFEKEYLDKTFGMKAVEQGEACGVRPHWQRVDWKDQHDHAPRLITITREDNRYYDYGSKQGIIHSVARTAQENTHRQPAAHRTTVEAVNSFLASMWESVFLQHQLVFGGVRVEEIKSRFTPTLVKEDDDCAWIQLRPRFLEDQADFEKVLLVLEKKTFFLRQAIYYQPNGNEIIWNVKHLKTTEKPPLPQDFKMLRYPMTREDLNK